MNALFRKHKYLLAYSLLFPFSYLLLNFNTVLFNQVVYGIPANILMLCLTCLFLLFEILYLYDTTFDIMRLKYLIKVRKPDFFHAIIVKESIKSFLLLTVIQLVSCYLVSHYLNVGIILLDKTGLLLIYLLFLKAKTTNEKKIDSILIFIFMVILHLGFEYLY